MRLSFRVARAEDVPQVLALLSDDILGKTREVDDLAHYQTAFAQMQAEGANHLIVGETPSGELVATNQITFIQGLSLAATRRAQIESVRISSALRGQGLGHQMFDDAKTRARDAGCRLIQLTMNASRAEANRFYEQLGFEPSHTGFKLYLD